MAFFFFFLGLELVNAVTMIRIPFNFHVLHTCSTMARALT